MASESLFGSTPVAVPKPAKAATPTKSYGLPEKASALKVALPHFKSIPSFHVVHPTHVPSTLLKGPTASEMNFHNPSLSTYSAASTGTGTGGSGSGSGFLGGLGSDITGFVGHLGQDAIAMAKGIPTGAVYMMEHPIAGAEKTVKATWADWSPLFEGHPGQWAHNFYEHPLAPILDVVGLATFGAGTAARAADVLGATGAAIDAARAGTAIEDAGVAARIGAKLNPAAHALAENYFKASQTGLTATERAAAIEEGAARGLDQAGSIERALQSKAADLQKVDPRAYRQITGPAGDTMQNSWSRNPLIRARQQLTHKLGDAAAESSAGQKLGLNKLVGNEATYRRWNFMDASRRSAAMAHDIQRNLAALSKMGDPTKLAAADAVKLVHDSVSRSLASAGRTVKTELVGQDATDAGIAYVKDPAKLDQAARAKVVGKGAGRVTQTKVLGAVSKIEASGNRDAAIEYGLKRAHAVNTTTDPAMALRDGEGNALAIPSDVSQKLQTEALNSHRAVRLLYDNPSRVWRFAMLGMSPRYFVNNFVGNTLMLAAATDPMSMARAFMNHIRITRGAEAAAQEWEASTIAAAQRYPTGAYGSGGLRGWHMSKADAAIQDRRLANVIEGGNTGMFGKEKAGVSPFNELAGEHQTMSRSVADQGAAEAKAGISVSQTMNRVPSLYGPTHRLADMPQRYMAMNYTLQRMPEYQSALEMYRGQGLSHEAAAYRAAQDALSNDAVRHTVSLQVSHMLGQYHTFRTWEKTGRRIVPFYAWDRAIAGHMRDLMATQPYKVAMLGHVGAMGSQERDSLIGQVPSFMQSMVPGSLLGIGNSPGRVGVLNANSLNPYASIADFAQTGLSMAGIGKGGPSLGDTLGAQLNPLIQQGASELSGTNLVTGAKLPNPTGGPILGLYGSMAQSPEQVQFIQQLLQGSPPSLTKTGKPTLYQKGMQSTLSSLLGIPIRQFSPSSAQTLAQQELPKAARPRKQRSYIPAF